MYVVVSPFTMEINKWYFVAGVVNGTHQILYVNGKRVSISSRPNFVFRRTIYPVGVGGWGDGTGDRWNGTIDEVMIFNTSLTQDQIKALYEFTRKKLISSGKTDTISSSPSTYLILASPKSKTVFEEVKINSKQGRKIRGIIPFNFIQFKNSLRIPPGNFQIKIENKGIDSLTGKTLIEISIL